MDIVQAVSGYITKMMSAGDSSAAGTSGAAKMKILLLDNETVGLSALSGLFGRLSSNLWIGAHNLDRHDAVRVAEPRSLPHRV